VLLSLQLKMKSGSNDSMNATNRPRIFIETSDDNE